jgi:hypothetical protein
MWIIDFNFSMNWILLYFLLCEHEVCLYLFLCSSRWQHKWEKEGTKKLNNMLYYFHYFYCSENLHSLKFNYLWFTNEAIKFWHICVWNHVRKITFYTKKVSCDQNPWRRNKNGWFCTLFQLMITYIFRPQDRLGIMGFTELGLNVPQNSLWDTSFWDFSKSQK